MPGRLVGWAVAGGGGEVGASLPAAVGLLLEDEPESSPGLVGEGQCHSLARSYLLGIGDHQIGPHLEGLGRAPVPILSTGAVRWRSTGEHGHAGESDDAPDPPTLPPHARRGKPTATPSSSPPMAFYAPTVLTSRGV
jgi:hypothetical protein